jgi:hypothetical protein
MSSYVNIKCRGLTASVGIKYILSHGTKEEAVKRVTQLLIPKGKATKEQEDVILAAVSTYYPTTVKRTRKKKVEDVIEDPIPEEEPNVTSETQDDN